MKEKVKKQNKVIYFIAFFIAIFLIVIGITTFYNIKYPIKYKDYIIKYADKYSLERELVASVINEESSYNSKAISKNGAIGLMQILPSTGEYIAKKLGDENYSTEKLFDEETNIRYGCYYLSYLKEKFSDKKVYLSAYNAGETTVSMWLKDRELSGDGILLLDIPYNVTKNYTYKILDGMRHYKGRI